MTVPEQAVEAAALAIAIAECCGLTINGRRALCDDPAAMEAACVECGCRLSARAALRVALPLMGVERPAFDALQLAKDIHRHWYQNHGMRCLSNDACVEASQIIEAALPAQSGSVQCREDVARAALTECASDFDPGPGNSVERQTRINEEFRRRQDIARAAPAGQPVEGDAHLSALWIAETRENARLRDALNAGLQRIERRKPLGWASTREWAQDILNSPAASAQAAADAEATLLMLDALSPAPASPQPREGEWQPIETAPKDGSRVLAWHEKWETSHTAQWFGTYWGVFYKTGPLLFQPTHWMSLPAPPVIADQRQPETKP